MRLALILFPALILAVFLAGWFAAPWLNAVMPVVLPLLATAWLSYLAVASLARRRTL